MASTSDRTRWKEQADFMREVGAVHAEWTFDPMGAHDMILTKLVLAPIASPARVMASAQHPPASPPTSPAKRLLQMHETQFAASRFKPRFVPPQQPDDVPRAVRAKEVTPSRGPKKVSKRGS